MMLKFKADQVCVFIFVLLLCCTVTIIFKFTFLEEIYLKAS